MQGSGGAGVFQAVGAATPPAYGAAPGTAMKQYMPPGTAARMGTAMAASSDVSAVLSWHAVLSALPLIHST